MERQQGCAAVSDEKQIRNHWFLVQKFKVQGLTPFLCFNGFAVSKFHAPCDVLSLSK
jgi:hypothetical protein